MKHAYALSAGNLSGLSPEALRPNAAQLEEAWRLYRARSKGHSARGWFDDKAWSRCVWQAIAQGSSR